MELTNITDGMGFFAVALAVAGVASVFLVEQRSRFLHELFHSTAPQSKLFSIVFSVVALAPFCAMFLSIDFFGAMNPLKGISSFYQITFGGQPYAVVETGETPPLLYLARTLSGETVQAIIQESFGPECYLAKTKVKGIDYSGHYGEFERWDVYKNHQTYGAICFEKKGFYYLVELPYHSLLNGS